MQRIERLLLIAALLIPAACGIHATLVAAQEEEPTLRAEVTGTAGTVEAALVVPTLAIAVPTFDLSQVTVEASAGIATHEAAMADGTIDEGERIVLALELPEAAELVRSAGGPPDEVRVALEALASSDVAPHDAAVTLEETAVVEAERGRIDSFGSFVRERLGEGLRGRELSAAIRAEHETRGRGHHGRGPDGMRGPDGVRGEAGAHGEAGEHGRDETRGPGAERGPEGGPPGLREGGAARGEPGEGSEGRGPATEAGERGRGPSGERGAARGREER